MTPDEHLALLRTEGARLAAMPGDALDAPVPTVPGWTLERVLRHTGKVHRWVAATLADGPEATMTSAGPVESLPRGRACLPAYEEALGQLVDALDGGDFDVAAPTFAGPGTVAFWARRQAQEVTVHRVDAADAVHAVGGGAPDPLGAPGAADGVDEWARLMLPRALGTPPTALHGRSVHLHGTDVPGAEWVLRFDAAGVTVESEHAKADVAIRGTAAELLLTMWRRRPLAALEVLGDADLAHRMLAAAVI